MEHREQRFKYVFGPVRSRRLGKSLGVNHVPYKTCTYSCVYCQLGRTINQVIERTAFYDPSEIVNEVREFLAKWSSEVDCITLVPDGEPLLDERVGLLIAGIKEITDKPVAVLSNGSLLYVEEARESLLGADIVSVKVDAVSEETWRRINRPHRELSLSRVLEGMLEFSRSFKGRLLTETMLVEGLNTKLDEVELVAEYIKALNPWRSYISIPVRPPAELFVKPPRPEVLVAVYNVFAEKLGSSKVELLNLPEPPEFKVHGEPEAWLLNLVSVHPLRLSYALRTLRDVVEDPEQFVNKLVEEKKVKVVEFSGEYFIVRAY